MGNEKTENQKQRYKNRKRRKKDTFAFRLGMVRDFKRINRKMKRHEKHERMHRD